MKIAWLTPLSRQTGIAKYSIIAVEALSRHAEVEIWTVPHDDDYPVDEKIPVHALAPGIGSLRDLNHYDLIVYNTGNNFEFNHEINELCTKKSGITIIHDRVLHHYFTILYLIKMKKPELYLDMMKNLYGKKGLKVAKRSLSSPLPVWETDEVADYPFIEPVLSRANGVIVHARDLMGMVQRYTSAPSVHLYFPYCPSDQSNPVPSREELKLPDGKFILLQYGHMASNKNVDRVIDALGADKGLRDDVHFVIVGDNETPYGNHVKNLVHEKGLDENVLFAGHVSDAELHGYLDHADACINLRFPCTEGASWSLVEQLFCGIPVIATNVGFYSEIPDDCIIKLPTANNTENLINAIRRLVDDIEYREKLARRGKEFALENFSPEEYAKKFMSFAEQVLAHRPASKALDRLIDTVSDELILMGIEEDAKIIDTVANEIHTFMG